MSAEPKRTDLDLLAIVDGLGAQVSLLRAEIIRRDEAQARDRARLIDAARSIAHADEMTSKEAAEFLNVSLSALNHAAAGTACLYRARIKNGSKITHLRKRVELHYANIRERKKCGDCDHADFNKYPRRVKQS